jgi:hypothetical protein
MTNLTQVMREAQAAIEAEQQRPTRTPTMEELFGADALRELDAFRATGELPQSMRGLKLLAIDVKLDAEI